MEKKTVKNQAQKLYLRQVHGGLQRFPRASPVRFFKKYSRNCCFKLRDIFDAKGEIKDGHVILGFTKDGQYLLSYSLVIDSRLEIPQPVYTYRLHWWRFQFSKPLAKVHSIPLFYKHHIWNELHLIVSQSLDEKQVIIWGRGLTSQEEQSCRCYVTICAALPTTVCLACKEITNTKCLEHSFSAHFTYETLPPYPVFSPSVSLQIPGIVFINTGDSLVALKCEPCSSTCSRKLGSVIQGFKCAKGMRECSEGCENTATGDISDLNANHTLHNELTMYSYRIYMENTCSVMDMPGNDDNVMTREIPIMIMHGDKELESIDYTHNTTLTDSMQCSKPSMLVCQAFIDIEQCIDWLVESNEDLRLRYKSLRDYDSQVLGVCPDTGGVVIMVKVLIYAKRIQSSLSAGLQISPSPLLQRTGFVFAWNVWNGTLKTEHCMETLEHPQGKGFSKLESTMECARKIRQSIAIPDGFPSRIRVFSNYTVFTEKSLKYLVHPYLPVIILL